jgi:ParB/RepB/Spo0J family partition protein
VNPRIQEIPLAEFDLSLSGMRIMNPARILQVEKSMRLHGQMYPVVARVSAEGYQMIDGFKRYHVAEDLMMETLQCFVLEIELSQAKVLLMSYNRSHQSMEAWEEAMVLQNLHKTHSLDQRSLARLTGHSRSWVSRRLSLIDKTDEKVSSEIMIGTLTSSHARALIKLPRCNQADVARVIINCGLSSRQSDTLVDAFLKAEDEDKRHHILNYPEQILWNDPADLKEEPYDTRLSLFGNELMQSTVNAIVGLQVLLSRLEDHRIDMFNETEKVIITPFLRKVSGYAEKLSEIISELQIYKSRSEQ